MELRNLLTRFLRIRKVLAGKDFYQFRDIRLPRQTFGNRFADWTFCPSDLHEDSVVYSFGVGEDISFDLALIKHFNLHVHAFDPSPRSIEWLKRQAVDEKFHFHPFGLAVRDGSISFCEPGEEGIHSLKMMDPENGARTGLVMHDLPVRSLPTIIKELKHNKIDILKMDIEGAEYELIQDIIQSSVPISQVLIEFHHRFENTGIGKTKEAISKLKKAGFSIFSVSSSGEEISFIKR